MRTHGRFLIAPIVAIPILAGSGGLASAAEVTFEFDAANFTPGQVIDNAYLPFIPGTVSVYFAESKDGCEVNETRVTGNTKDDFGPPYVSIVAWEVEDRAWFDEGCHGDYALVEQTKDWYAQDDFKNVWYLGEDTVAWDHDDECPSTGGAWEAGEDGAIAGVVMPGNPVIGTWYQQEYFEGEAEDRAKVLKLNATVSIGLGTYAGCLRTKEYSPLAPGEVEQKNYCPEGGGLLLVDELHGGPTRHVELIGSQLPAGNFAANGVCP
jgi:hypothetical protein